MKTDSNFLRLDNASQAASREVRFFWEGQEISARQGDTIAAALLAAGISHTRETPVSQSGRAPFCMMGSCFECRVEVDGEHNVQACMRPVESGLNVRRQRS